MCDPNLLTPEQIAVLRRLLHQVCADFAIADEDGEARARLADTIMTAARLHGGDPEASARRVAARLVYERGYGPALLPGATRPGPGDDVPGIPA